MTHIRFACSSLLILGLTSACHQAPRHSAVQHEGRPNIVWFMADDLGWGELGCYGQDKIRTPRVDQLAAEGMLFEQHYSGAPVCAPARCVLMTGMHSGHAYVRGNFEIGGWGDDDGEGQLPLPEGTTTLPGLLQTAGYATCAVGKWGLGGPDTSGEPNRQGFDHWFGYLCQRQAHNQYPTHLWRNGERVDLEGNVWKNLTGEQYAHDLMADEILGWIRDNADGPFFVYVPFHIPHAAIQVPQDSLDEYDGAFDADPAYSGDKGYLPHATPRAAYAAMITRMDRDVGRIVDLLDELGVRDNTLVAFSSDNGPTFNGGTDSTFFQSAAHFRGLKGSVYEGGLRVPLVVNWPGNVSAGSRTRHLSAFQDVMPTLLDIAGVPTPDDLDGISFAPTLRSAGEQQEHEALYFEFPSYGGQQAVRAGRWKLVRRQLLKGKPTFALYDMEADESEAVDVASLHPAVVERLMGIADREHKPSEHFPFPALD
jgi:arylsulfatase A